MAAILPSVAAAQSVTPPFVNAPAIVQPRTPPPLVDLQIQESIERRHDFQQLQQIQRQQDRDQLRYRPERPEVPVMKPSCTTSVYGSSVSAGCR